MQAHKVIYLQAPLWVSLWVIVTLEFVIITSYHWFPKNQSTCPDGYELSGPKKEALFDIQAKKWTDAKEINLWM